MKAMLLAVLALGFAASAALADDMVDNPLYKQWAAQKPGASVKQQITTTGNAAGQPINSKSTITTTLKEVTPDKVVLEIVIEFEASGAAPAIPAQTQEVAAKIAPAATQPTSNPGVTTTKKGEGDEEITVGGKKYKAHWVEYESASAQVQSTSKTWTADDVPGRTIKSVSQTTKPIETKTVMELIEFKPAN